LRRDWKVDGSNFPTLPVLEHILPDDLVRDGRLEIEVAHILGRLRMVLNSIVSNPPSFVKLRREIPVVFEFVG